MTNIIYESHSRYECGCQICYDLYKNSMYCMTPDRPMHACTRIYNVMYLNVPSKFNASLIHALKEENIYLICCALHGSLEALRHSVVL